MMTLSTRASRSTSNAAQYSEPSLGLDAENLDSQK
jgi:hypothetical protein